MIHKKSILLLPFLVLPLFFSHFEESYSQRLSVEIETGVFWFSLNDVRIPSDGGVQFDLAELIGYGVTPYFRVRAQGTFNRNHIVRLQIAPLQASGTGPFFEPVQFQDSVFLPFLPTRGSYQFNTYRLTYRYLFYRNRSWELGAGIAGLLRDAKIQLVQANLRETNSDIGVVPLLHFYAKRNFNNTFFGVFDIESLVANQGRATDAMLSLNLDMSPSWNLFAGYRILEGGVDNDSVYNFSWINYAFIGIKMNIR